MLCKIVRIVEVNNTFLISLNNISRQKHSSCKVTTDLTGHIVTLNAVDGRVLIWIFLLYFLVIALDKRKNSVIGSICLTNKRTIVAVTHISSCKLKRTLCHELILNHILNFFNGHCSPDFVALIFNIVGNILNLFVCKELVFPRTVCFFNGINNFFNVEIFFWAVTLNNSHNPSPFYYFAVLPW